MAAENRSDGGINPTPCYLQKFRLYETRSVKLSVSGKDVKLTLIARRSRHYAGTRYLKRGVNEKGKVANDVETEQIVFEDVPEGCPTQISCVVQNRGSIPLFWSQETSRLNLKPDIICRPWLTRCEKKPRETILRTEFAKSIRFINKILSKEKRLRFLHWDLNRHSRKATNVLELLGKVADYALKLTGIFYCQVTPNRIPEGLLNLSCLVQNDEHLVQIHSDKSDDKQNSIENLHAMGFTESQTIDQNSPLAEDLMVVYEKMGDTLALQYGGSAAHNKIFCQRRGQWQAATQSQEFFRSLQRYYSNAYMDAESKVPLICHFQPQQGKPALWELDSDQHYSVGSRGSSLLNADARFLGHFQPQQGKPALWELDSDQHIALEVVVLVFLMQMTSFKRSLSDGNILWPMGASTVGHHQPLSENTGKGTHDLSESTREMPTRGLAYSRFTRLSCRQLLEICMTRSITGLSSETEIIGDELRIDMAISPSDLGMDRTASKVTRYDIIGEYSESFVDWVTNGDYSSDKRQVELACYRFVIEFISTTRRNKLNPSE
ncbi:Phosphoinositide phosphatase SAC2 [Hibiscus syriacus]|uniref:Phosphoinositide phosphatase SAC2 n=1 Tax=Hibiscus syriacus TaxID=106335 RepID=A0A6A3C6W6_HIBSY|nr:Phosphoinositide phosphatase SAC2 [Hibiscus syriacus]